MIKDLNLRGAAYTEGVNRTHLIKFGTFKYDDIGTNYLFSSLNKQKATLTNV